MDKSVSKKIIDKIKKDHIAPEPKWKVNMSNYLFWALLGLIVLLAAGFLSLIILSFIDFDIELYRLIRIRRFAGLLFLSAPYLWLVLFVLSIALSYLAFRKTKKGYRHNVLLIATIILFLVSMLGVGAHVAKVNNRLEQGIARKAPFLNKFAPPRGRHLMCPEKGILSGHTTEVRESFLTLEDFNRKKWEVRYDNETRIGRREKLEQGLDVLVVGKMIDSDSFDAEMIRQIRPRAKGYLPLEGGKPAPGKLKMKVEMRNR